MQLEIPIVGQTDTPYATRDMVQRKTFQAAGLTWVFYSNGVDGVYRVSPDGMAWSEEAVFKEGCGDGREFSTFFDGRYVHFVYAKNVSGEPVLYWRGEPKRDGVIEWSVPEQLVNQETGYSYEIPNVCVDSEGYPWITYGRRSGYNVYARIYKSAVKDGLWETNPELVTPYSVNITGGYALPIPLRNGRLYFLLEYGYLQGFLWDGEKWGDREYFSIGCRNSTAIGYNDDVHFVYSEDYKNIVYRKRIAGIGWTGPISVFPAGVTTYSSLTLDPGTGDLYCIWIGAPKPNGLYYSRYDAKTERWDGWPTEFMEIPLSADKTSLNTYGKVQNGRLGIIYRAGYAVPYDICFSSLSFVPTLDPIWVLMPAAIGVGLVVLGRS